MQNKKPSKGEGWIFSGLAHSLFTSLKKKKKSLCRRVLVISNQLNGHPFRVFSRVSIAGKLQIKVALKYMVHKFQQQGIC